MGGDENRSGELDFRTKFGFMPCGPLWVLYPRVTSRSDGSASRELEPTWPCRKSTNRLERPGNQPESL